MGTDSADLRVQTAASMLRWLRKRKRLSQNTLAKLAHFSTAYISSLERGVRELPPDTLEVLAGALELSDGERGQWLAAAGYGPPPSATTIEPSARGIPRTPEPYGRDQELAELLQAITEDSCHVVAVVGLAGIGKTTLGATLAARLSDQFDRAVWQSLAHASPPEAVLRKCLDAIAGETPHVMLDADELVQTLVHQLEAHRTLLVLDDFEAVLDAGTPAPTLRPGDEAYGALLHAVAGGKHGSCVLLLSRELPEELAQLEGDSMPVRIKRLSGIAPAAGERILRERGVTGASTLRREISLRYRGHPFALKIVAGVIRELFAGDLARFDSSELRVLGRMRVLLDASFARLSPRERDVLYWLAIVREPVAPETLRARLIPAPALGQVIETLHGLEHRGLIEVAAPGQFTVHPVVMEYLTDRLVDTACEEVLGGSYRLLAHHALVTGRADDGVRRSQRRALLSPLAERLRSILGEAHLDERLRDALATLRQQSAGRGGYAAANVLHLLLHLGCDLHGLDCSRLALREVDLREADLSGADFRGADLIDCAFAESFGGVLSLAWCGAGHRLAASTTSGEVCLWSVRDGTHERTIHPDHAWMWTVAASPDGKLLASGGDDRVIRLWDAESGTLLRCLDGHEERVRAVAFSPDGQLLASAGDDSTVRLWDLAGRQETRVLRGHDGRVRAVSFSPNGRVLASAGDDQVVRLWAVETGRPHDSLSKHHGRLRTLAFNADGSLLASAGDDGTIVIWKVNIAKPQWVLRPHTRILSLAFSPNGQILASGGEDKAVRLWDVASGQEVSDLQGHRVRVRAVAFSPDGQVLASGSEDQTIMLWQTGPARLRTVLRPPRASIRALALRPAAGAVASAREDGTIRVHDVATGEVLQILRGYRDAVVCVAYSPDGMLVAGGSLDGAVRVQRVLEPDDDVRTLLHAYQTSVRAIAFSPDGRLLATAGDDGAVRVWEVETWRQHQTFQTSSQHLRPVRAIAFSPNGRLLASGGDDGTVRFWDTQQGQEIRALTGHDHRVLALAFSPEGQLLATAGADRMLRLWNVADGASLGSFLGHSDWVRTLAFSPDGSLLASAGDDATVRIWNPGGKQLVLIRQAHTARVTTVVFRAGGSEILSAGEDGAIRRWDPQTGAVLSILASGLPYDRMRIAGARGLTPAQASALRALGAVE